MLAFVTKETRLMRRLISRVLTSGLVALGVVCYLAGPARGQNYEVPDSYSSSSRDGFWGILPGPLGHPRYEDGGFFTAIEFVYFQQSNPIGRQTVAVRGFVDDDGTNVPKGHGPEAPGTFHGSGLEALNTRQLERTADSFSPGFNLVGGYRFQNGWVFQVSWLYLLENRYTATASLIPQNHAVGPQLADTFLFSNVFNFTPNYAGEANRTGLGNPGSVFGIWNGSSEQSIELVQRFDQVDITLRIPVWQNDTHRQYALFGPRFVGIWERFKWRTVSEDVTGISSSDDTANYTNTVSNMMYGVHVGGGHDWWLGNTPIGGFSVSLDGEAALFYDYVKERAQYALGDRSTAATHNRNTYQVVPELQAKLSVWYYPCQAVQVRLGYDVMAFFNTISSPEPIDFNFGTISPRYTSTFRLFNGLSIGAGIVF
jgi:hypothetical protein